MPEFPAELLPSLLKADTTSRASNADILSFFSKTPLLIDRLRYIRDSYKVVFTELLLEDDTRVGFYKESNALLVWQGSYLTRSAESHLSWHSVTAAISALVDNHELIAAIDPKKAISQDEQLSFDLPENASRGDEVGTLEVDDIYSEEEQDEKIKAALPAYHYKEPRPDDGSHITEDDVNVIITRGSVFEGGKYRIYNHFQQKKTEKETVAFLKKEYGIGGFSWTFADGGSGFVNFDGKGFSILYDFKDDLRYEKKLKWKEVGKRLEYLVRMDRYLTDAEREKMPAWINRQAESKPLPPPIPDQKPVCEVGSTVYLENDQRFTVESIGQFDIHLRNEDFPLVGRAVSREQFQQLLDANPRNGGMVLSEQQRESLVQEQREQALSYIEDYLKDEFEITQPDFSDLTQIGLGYTTTEDEQHTIQVHADLEHCTIRKFVDDSATINEANVYVGSNDGNLYCIDLDTGYQKWCIQTGDFVISKPAITSEGNIVFGSGDEFVYCASANDGNVIWNTKLGGSVLSDPLTSEGRVFIGCGDGKIYCLNSASGEIVWGYQTDGLMRQRPILENGILYAFVRDTYIWYAIDASTGQLIWRGNANTDESLFVCGDVRPVIANGKLWCIDAQNTRPAYLSLDTGELAWTSTLEKVSSRGMTTNGSTVFYSSNSGRQITAFDAETNQVVWQKDLRYDNKDRDLQEMQIDSALVYNGNSLIHVAERGRITALNPDNGEILWRIDAAGYPERVFWATPEATDSLVIATGIDGKVYAVEYTH